MRTLTDTNNLRNRRLHRLVWFGDGEDAALPIGAEQALVDAGLEDGQQFGGLQVGTDLAVGKPLFIGLLLTTNPEHWPTLHHGLFHC